jgi:hypothetical protein
MKNKHQEEQQEKWERSTFTMKERKTFFLKEYKHKNSELRTEYTRASHISVLNKDLST